MEKRINIFLVMAIVLTSLLLIVIGCGTGDKGSVERLNVISGDTTSGSGGGNPGGGGGGNGTGTGVCIETLSLLDNQTLSTCYAGKYNEAECNKFIESGITVVWYAGASSCEPYGFTLTDCWGDTSYTSCVK